MKGIKWIITAIAVYLIVWVIYAAASHFFSFCTHENFRIEQHENMGSLLDNDCVVQGAAY